MRTPRAFARALFMSVGKQIATRRCLRANNADCVGEKSVSRSAISGFVSRRFDARFGKTPFRRCSLAGGKPFFEIVPSLRLSPGMGQVYVGRYPSETRGAVPRISSRVIVEVSRRFRRRYSARVCMRPRIPDALENCNCAILTLWTTWW